MQNLLVLGTVFIPFGGAILALAFTRYNRFNRWLAFVASLLSWGCSLGLIIQVFGIGIQTYRMGGYVPPFGIVLVADTLSALFAFMCTSVLMAGFMYCIHCHDKCIGYPAFLPLFLFMMTGLLGAVLTGDLFTFFVFMEIMVLSSVSLVAISDDKFGLEAAFKYLFISGMGSLLLLLGTSAMYSAFGTLNFADMAQQLLSGDRPIMARGAAIILACSFLLKSAVFPFHFWQPDFHTTAPTPVHAVLSSVVVKIGVYGVIRLLTLLFTEEAPQVEGILLWLGVIGIFFGSLCALRTYNGKRLLAYSTISQIGFILVGIGWGTPLALMAAVVYAFNHAFVKSGLLMVMGLMSSRTNPKSADFKDVAGAGRLMPPLIGVLWLVGGMALAGIPPLNGFISKLAIVQSGTQIGDWLPLFLAVFGGILTITYVFRTWQTVFQAENKQLKLEIKPYGDGMLAPLLLISVCVVLGLFARPLVGLAELTVQQISDPQIYIQAVGLFSGG
jgi:multicomponent Na+:H+ antiporter subunit D